IDQSPRADVWCRTEANWSACVVAQVSGAVSDLGSRLQRSLRALRSSPRNCTHDSAPPNPPQQARLESQLLGGSQSRPVSPRCDCLSVDPLSDRLITPTRRRVGILRVLNPRALQRF